jgi:perosamine synthetase
MNGKSKYYCGFPGINLKPLLRDKQSRRSVKTWFDSGDVYYLHMARTGIRFIPELLGLEQGSEILVPSYNCGAEIDPLIKYGIKIVPYRIDRSCNADIYDISNRITHKTKAIYVTHYFGFPQKIDAIMNVCKQHILYLIEDCALSLFSRSAERKLGSFGDVSIFSLIKSLPVPDGGVLMINNKELQNVNWHMYPPEKLRILRGLLPLIKSTVLKGILKINALKPLYLFIMKLDSKRKISHIRNDVSDSKNKTILSPEQYYDGNLSNRKMSSVAKYLLNTFDVDDIIMRRRRNFNLFQSLITNCDIEPLFKELPEGVCPLCFPMFSKNRNYLQIKLYERNIYTDTWWDGYHKSIDWDCYPDACYLKENILTLPIHEGLDDQDIACIAENLIDLIKSS